MFTKKQLKMELVKQLAKALIFVAVSSIAVYMLSGEIAKISQGARQNRTAVAILEKKNELATELKNDLIAIGNGDEKVAEAFIKAEDIVGFVNELEKIAQANSLEQTLRFGNPVPLPKDLALKEMGSETPQTFELLKVEFDIALRGKAIAFNSYLEEFEKLPYFTSISSIVVMSSPTPDSEEQSSISVKAELYVRQ